MTRSLFFHAQVGDEYNSPYLSRKIVNQYTFIDLDVIPLTRSAMQFILFPIRRPQPSFPGMYECSSSILHQDRITNRVGAGIQLATGILTQPMLDDGLFQIKEVLDFSALSDKLALLHEIKLVDKKE